MVVQPCLDPVFRVGLPKAGLEEPETAVLGGELGEARSDGCGIDGWWDGGGQDGMPQATVVGVVVVPGLPGTGQKDGITWLFEGTYPTGEAAVVGPLVVAPVVGDPEWHHGEGNAGAQARTKPTACPSGLP